MRKLLRGRRRAWLALPLVLLVAAATFGVWLMTRDTSQAATRTTTTVSSQTIEQTVSADGTIAALRSSDESFAVSGTVTRVLVEEGDKVKVGAALARVDDTALIATRTAAVSSLDAAVAQLGEDQDNGESDVQVAADNAAVVSARASLADAREAVGDATLRASIAGTVTSVSIAKGDASGSASSSGSGASTGVGGADTSSSATDTSSGTISIVSTNAYVVDATVAAEDAKQLNVGLQAEITATGVDDTIYGTVAEVGLVAQTNDSGAAVFPVTIAVTGTQQDLYSGVSATVTIVTKQIPDVLTVPTNALSTADGTTYVTLLVDGKDEKTEVEVGETYAMSTEITSGVEEGDEVVVQSFRAPSGSGSDAEQQDSFPGGERPDFGQQGGDGQAPAGGPGQ